MASSRKGSCTRRNYNWREENPPVVVVLNLYNSNSRTWDGFVIGLSRPSLLHPLLSSRLHFKLLIPLIPPSLSTPHPPPLPASPSLKARPLFPHLLTLIQPHFPLPMLSARSNSRSPSNSSLPHFPLPLPLIQPTSHSLTSNHPAPTSRLPCTLPAPILTPLPAPHSSHPALTSHSPSISSLPHFPLPIHLIPPLLPAPHPSNTALISHSPPRP